MKLRYLAASAVLAVAASIGGAQAQAAQTVITFDNIPEGTIATNQYNGVVISGASVLTEGSALNPPFPPFSDPNVVYDFDNGTIGLDFTNPVTEVGGYITGNTNITLSIYDGATLLGTVSTGGANYTGSGGTPNIFLDLTSAEITSATFSNGEGFGNTFTLDNLTIGGTITTNGVPEPATWAMMLMGFGGLGAAMRSARRKQAIAA